MVLYTFFSLQQSQPSQLSEAPSDNGVTEQRPGLVCQGEGEWEGEGEGGAGDVVERVAKISKAQKRRVSQSLKKSAGIKSWLHVSSSIMEGF